jgi:hypothetical protein
MTDLRDMALPAPAEGEALADRLRLPLAFDPHRLAADLATLAQSEWTAHFVSANYTGNWSVLPLRAPAGVDHPILRIASHPGVEDWQDTEALAACGYFRAVLAAFDCPIGAARLMRLTPGSSILEHRDADLAAEFGTARLHIAVATNPDVDFRLNAARVIMRAGECWYLRLADPHSVVNGGTSDRVHLVIDASVNDWLRRQLALAAPTVRD